MRLVARALLCLTVLAVVAGCDPATNRAYFREGVGSSLYTDDVVAQTALQDLYVQHICAQAGLTYSDVGASCGRDPYYDPKTWWLFVQAGMNDIDRRCDGYLTWLDNVRRSEAPILKQITDTQTATALIMSAAGVTGAAPIAIVAAAFGLAANTFTNVTSRLILEVNQSTVQSVVLSHQKAFREQLVGSANRRPQVLIPNKPAAIYALRSYLRLCMPMTIETEINDTVATIARGGPQALVRSEPMISAKSVGAPVIKSVGAPAITSVKKPLPAQPKISLPNPLGHTDAEKRIGPEEVADIQAALCVTGGGTDLGPDGSPTRLAIRDYLLGIQYRGITEGTKSVNVDDRIRTKLSQVTNAVGDCSKSEFGFANAYEVGRFGIPASRSARRIMTFQKKLKKLIEANAAGFPPPEITGKFDGKTRAAIAEYRKKATPPLLKDAPLDEQVDRALFIKVNAERP